MVKACKEITLKYGYHLGEGKDLVNRQALKGKEKIRYELYDAIKAGIKAATSWKELEIRLARQGVSIAYKFRSDTSEVQGALPPHTGKYSFLIHGCLLASLLLPVYLQSSTR